MASSQNPTPEQDGGSRDESTESSATHSRNDSGTPREQHRVRFTPGGESLDDRNVRAAFDVQGQIGSVRKQQSKPLPRPRINPIQRDDGRSISAPQPTDSSASLNITNFSASSSISQARPLKIGYSGMGMTAVTNEEKRAKSQEEAQQRAAQLSLLVGSHSAPASRGNSPIGLTPGSPAPSTSSDFSFDWNSIPLENLQRRARYGIEDDTEDEEEDEASQPRPRKKAELFRAAADRFVKLNTTDESRRLFRVQAALPGLPSGPSTPIEEQNLDDYVPKPKEYRRGYLSSFLKLHKEQGVRSALAAILSLPTPALGSYRFGGDGGEAGQASASRGSPADSPNVSDTSTPRRKTKWYYRNASSASTESIASFVNSSSMLAQPATSMAAGDHSGAIRPMPKRRTKAKNVLDKILGRGQEDAIIEVHIVETLSRQIYLMKMCQALMQYGAPTHRLEGRWDPLHMTKSC